MNPPCCVLSSAGGGVFPQLKESDYLSNGQFRIDKGGAPAMLNSLMYKLCYHRFDEASRPPDKPSGYDMTRNVEIGNKGFKMRCVQ